MVIAPRPDDVMGMLLTRGWLLRGASCYGEGEGEGFRLVTGRLIYPMEAANATVIE